ncbi:hypothetical protein B0H14DRAFT_2580585 [Mycena olivaceomarginata]|nr:hypothetical protein B0H14DRAFT_2580585 [Mycena olivaceomarginata]
MTNEEAQKYMNGEESAHWRIISWCIFLRAKGDGERRVSREAFDVEEMKMERWHAHRKPRTTKKGGRPRWIRGKDAIEKHWQPASAAQAHGEAIDTHPNPNQIPKSQQRVSLCPLFVLILSSLFPFHAFHIFYDIDIVIPTCQTGLRPYRRTTGIHRHQRQHEPQQRLRQHRPWNALRRGERCRWGRQKVRGNGSEVDDVRRDLLHAWLCERDKELRFGARRSAYGEDGEEEEEEGPAKEDCCEDGGVRYPEVWKAVDRCEEPGGGGVYSGNARIAQSRRGSRRTAGDYPVSGRARCSGRAWRAALVPVPPVSSPVEEESSREISGGTKRATSMSGRSLLGSQAMRQVRAAGREASLFEGFEERTAETDCRPRGAAERRDSSSWIMRKNKPSHVLSLPGPGGGTNLSASAVNVPYNFLLTTLLFPCTPASPTSASLSAIYSVSGKDASSPLAIFACAVCAPKQLYRARGTPSAANRWRARVKEIVVLVLEITPLQRDRRRESDFVTEKKTWECTSYFPPTARPAACERESSSEVAAGIRG